MSYPVITWSEIVPLDIFVLGILHMILFSKAIKVD